MELSDKYHYFFDNKGKCPECGEMLIMNFGCVNFNCPIARENICTSGSKSQVLSIMKSISNYYLFDFQREKFYEKIKLRKLQYLDKQPKKQYIKIDDSGISE
ncbi:MAG: hypothetical protein PHN56_07190 [Candidatus Nanoarchaeia archaeon]|nr:hypothetical protein [Candidatus Nanoarchaeia archaeon]